jgi:hypothetical protein
MKQHRIVVSIAATVACLFGASVHAELKTETAATQTSEAALARTSAPVNPEANAALERRTVYLKKQIERKLNRKPKRERDAEVTKWQVAGRSAEGAVAFDQPQGAMTAFLEKRLATGSTAIAPSDYEEALKRASKMPVYSTFEGKMISSGNPDAQGGVVARSAGNSLEKSGALASNWQALRSHTWLADSPDHPQHHVGRRCCGRYLEDNGRRQFLDPKSRSGCEYCS